jgi:hypothetical protein
LRFAFVSVGSHQIHVVLIHDTLPTPAVARFFENSKIFPVGAGLEL